MPTQKQTVLKMLRDAGSRGVRSDAFYREFLGRGVARIYDLRQDGYEISSEKEGKYKRYFLTEGVGVGAGNVPASGVLGRDGGNASLPASVDPGEPEPLFGGYVLDEAA